MAAFASWGRRLVREVMAGGQFQFGLEGGDCVRGHRIGTLLAVLPQLDRGLLKHAVGEGHVAAGLAGGGGSLSIAVVRLDAGVPSKPLRSL